MPENRSLDVVIIALLSRTMKLENGVLMGEALGSLLSFSQFLRTLGLLFVSLCPMVDVWRSSIP